MKPFRFLISSFWLIFAAAVIVLALLLSGVRLALPMMGEYRGEVSAWVGDILGQPVRIGGLRASWHNTGPSVELSDVTVLDAEGQNPVLQCTSARIDINVIESLRHWQFEPGLLTVRGIHVSVVRHEDGSIAVAGFRDIRRGGMDVSSQDTLKQWLQRQERLAIEDSSFQWRDLAQGDRVLEFTQVNMQLRNRRDRHLLDAAVELPQALGQGLRVEADLQGDLFTPASWRGQIYARGAALRPGGWWGRQPHFGIAALDGAVDFQAWSDWQDGAQQVEGEIHAGTLHLVREVSATPDPNTDASDAGQVNIAAVEGGFHWQRRTAGWVVDVDRFSVNRRDGASSPAQLRVEYQDQGAGRRHIRSAYSALRVEDVAGLLLDAKLVPDEYRERLSAMAPQGMLRDGYVDYREIPQQTPHFVLRTAFENLGFRPNASIPGVQGFSGNITADNGEGVASVNTGKAAVDFTDLFRAPLPVDSLTGQLAWRRDDKSLQVFTPEMTAGNEDIKLKVGFRLDVPKDDTSPYLDMNASFSDGNGEHASRYLPVKIMLPDTVAWLEKAIVNGRVSDGSARIVGRLADFPFDKGQGQFDIRFDVTDGILQYAKEWPRLEDLDSEIHFLGRRFEAHATAAKSLNSEILDAKVAIPDMSAHPALLTVEGKAQGPVADALRYVTETPLHGKLGTYMDSIAAGGNSRLQLNLKLPLAKLPARVNGSLQFDNGSLSFREADIDFTHIDGALKFNEDGLAAKDIHADILGQPAIIAVDSKPGQTGTITTFSAQGTADTAVVAKRFAPPLAAYVSGSAPWQGSLRIPPKSEGWVELEVSSPLNGVEVRLPDPMGKTPDASRKLLLQVPLPLKGEKPIHARYGDFADAQLLLNNGKSGLDVVRGEVLFGGGVAVVPAQGKLRIAGTLPAFDETQWSPILEKASPDKDAAASSVVSQVAMEIGQLNLPGMRLDKVDIQADHGDNAWDVDIKSDQAQGRIHVPDAGDAPLTADMDRLYLARFKKGGSGGSGVDPRKMHPLDIRAKSFHYGDLDLGELQVRAERIPAGLEFADVHAHTAERDMRISGKWVKADDGQQSSFKLVYDGQDAGATLTALGFADMINGGKAHTEMSLAWRGQPTDFSLAKTAGSISFEIKDGRLLDVEPGAGRVLGLLSFQALPRRLVFDFRDIFQKGFSFDDLAGSFAIENGDARTDNLFMVGPAARIEARGRVGLAAEDYDQRVTVIPNFTSGLPVAGVIAGGVGAGAALFLMEKVLKPGIDSITKVDYRVTGPWTNPVVERMSVATQDKKSDQQGKTADGKK